MKLKWPHLTLKNLYTNQSIKEILEINKTLINENKLENEYTTQLIKIIQNHNEPK